MSAGVFQEYRGPGGQLQKYTDTTGAAEVVGKNVQVTVEITREANATPYTAGDVVSAAAATVVPAMAFASFAREAGLGGYIVGARISTDQKSVTPRIRVHLFNVNTATISGDNLPYRSLYADISKRMGYFDLPAMTTPADTSNSTESRAIDMTIRFPFVSVTTTIYAVLETLDAFTPSGGSKFSLTLVGELN